MTNSKALQLGLTGSTIISILVAPLAAYGQFSPVQNAEQSVTIRGSNNTVNQSINQTIVVQPGSASFRGLKKKKFKKSRVRNHDKKYWKHGKDYSKSKGWDRDWDDDDDDDDDEWEYDDD